MLFRRFAVASFSATPLFAAAPRYICPQGIGDYPGAVRRVALEPYVPLIDRNTMSKALDDAIGPQNTIRPFAAIDTKHHSDHGRRELATGVGKGIRCDGLPPEKLPADTPPLDTTQPDSFQSFDVSADPPSGAGRPYGP